MAPHSRRTGIVTALLFAVTALLWGGGALATTMQVGVTPASWSVAMRMLLAGMLLLAWGRFGGTSLRIPRGDRVAVAVQGALFFALAFIAFYEATHRIPSGLAALVLSTSSLFAAVFGRLWLGTAFPPGLLLGAGCGVLGIALIFVPDVEALRPGSLGGLGWAFVAALAAGAGTVAGARNQRAGLPVLAVLGWGAIAGAIVCVIWAALARETFVLDSSSRYIASLLYLAVAATCVTFLCYFELVRRQGPARAAYVLAVVPLVALVLSALFENLSLGLNVLLGAIAIVTGNVLVLRR